MFQEIKNFSNDPRTQFTLVSKFDDKQIHKLWFGSKSLQSKIQNLVFPKHVQLHNFENHTFCLLVHYSPSARNKQLKPIYSFSNYKNLTVEEQEARLYSSPTRVNPFQRLFFHKDLHASPNKLDLTVTPVSRNSGFCFLMYWFSVQERSSKHKTFPNT